MPLGNKENTDVHAHGGHRRRNRKSTHGASAA
jgi:hypothetical protein